MFRTSCHVSVFKSAKLARFNLLTRVHEQEITTSGNNNHTITSLPILLINYCLPACVSWKSLWIERITCVSCVHQQSVSTALSFDRYHFHSGHLVNLYHKKPDRPRSPIRKMCLPQDTTEMELLLSCVSPLPHLLPTVMHVLYKVRYLQTF